ncbi:hypothetical protein ACP4OV_025145 [Aristida adscensionis]
MTTAARRWRVRRPPRPPPVRRSMAAWEKDFCASRGVPWKKVTDPDVGLNADADGNRRYWAEINGGLVNPRAAAPPLPDSDMYIDVIGEDGGGGGVDPELDTEYEVALRDMERAREQYKDSFRTSLELPADYVPVPTGWDV